MWPKRWLYPKDFDKRSLLEIFANFDIKHIQSQKNNDIFEINISKSLSIYTKLGPHRTRDKEIRIVNKTGNDITNLW